MTEATVRKIAGQIKLPEDKVVDWWKSQHRLGVKPDFTDLFPSLEKRSRKDRREV